MRVLFVTSTYPEDIQACRHGIYQRMKLFIEAIQDFADLDILFYVGPGVDIAPERAVRMEKMLEEHWHCKAGVLLCRRSQNTSLPIPSNFPFSDRLKAWWFVHPYYYGAAGLEQVAAFEKCLERRPDAVFVHRLTSIAPILSSRKLVQPVFFDLDDIEHKAFVRGLRQPPFWPSKYLEYLKVPSLMWLERRAIARAKKTFVCSESDRDHLKRSLYLSNVVAIPNAVEMPPYTGQPETPTFLFLGSYLFPPNVAAADDLVKKLWPAVKREVPGAKLIIAGKNPENIGSFHGQHDGVEFRGFVHDLDALYRETRVVCCPVRSGSGTRIKIIEAAAYGKAIVSTALGAEGLEFVDGQEILLQDDHELFARACIDLITDRPRCGRIGEAARTKANLLYSRNSALNKIRHEMQLWE